MRWSEKYPHIFRSGTDWEKLTIFFNYPAETLRLIYTTAAVAANVIENLDKVLRKYTKGKTIFPSEEALQKSNFLAVEHISRKWAWIVFDLTHLKYLTPN